MRRKAWLAWAVAWLAVGSWCGWAWPADLTRSAQEYIALRADRRAVVDLSASAVRARLHQLAGQVVEVAGTICGVMSRSTATIEGRRPVTFILRPEDGSPSVFVDCTEGVPEVQSGNRVRILTRLDNTSPTLSRVALVAIVAENDLPESWRRPTSPDVAAGGTNPGATATPPQDPPNPTSPAPNPPPPGVVGPTEVVLAGPDSPMETAANRTLNQPPPASGGVPEDFIEQYKAWVGEVNPKLSQQDRDLIVRSVLTYSHQFGLNHNLVFAMLRWESSFNPRAVSHAGAQGLGQLMPGTAKALGVANSFDIVENIRGSVQYLAAQMNRYADRPNQERFCLGMACYNAGPNAVARAGHKVPKIAETTQYINRVARLFAELEASFR